jgi:ribonuclease HII
MLVDANQLIAGVDEAGRGPLAGPVVAAAVILNGNLTIDGVKDSKQLSARQRELLVRHIKERALCYAVAEASVEEIDNLNILQATLLAMRRAVDGLNMRPDKVWVDGNRLPTLTVPAQAIIKGDTKIPAISAASILAKVHRDERMVSYQIDYPQFSFQNHKGYGTRQHLAEIKKYGYLPIHRKSFQPVKTMILAS